tara:strand:+ start:841 stop:1461 length:621 start_codon:yes stop_codon:yes gene_type:complete
MPGKSNFSKTQDIISAICQVDGFIYTEDEMWEFVKQTDMKIKEPANKSSKPRHCSAYSVFMKENKKGMDDTKELSEQWKQMKEEENEEYKRYVEMAQEKDKDNGLEPSSGSKTQSQTQEKKLLIELITERVKGTEDEGKPMFLGKKIDSPVNNYKEWKKAQLGQDTPISRDELKKYKDEDDFNDKSMEGMEWDNYIRDNMIFAEDV